MSDDTDITAQNDTMKLNDKGQAYTSEAKALEALKKKELNPDVWGVCSYNGGGFVIDKLAKIFERMREQQQNAVVKNAQDSRKKIRYMEVILAGKQHPNEYTKVPVGNNGVFYWLERGVKVILPSNHVDVLRDAVQDQYGESSNDEVPYELIGEVNRYPFTVIREDVPEEEFIKQVEAMRKLTKKAVADRQSRNNG